MMADLIQVVTGALGALGFALIAHVRLKHLGVATLGGLLSWAIFLPFYHAWDSVFLPSLISAMVVYAWSEVMARVMKAPVTIFLVPGILPLLPGSFLYYTMQALMNNDMALFEHYGVTTIAVTLGIACGVVAASIVVSYFIKTTEHLKQRRNKH